MWFEIDGPVDLGLVADRVHLITITNADTGKEYLGGVRQSGGTDPDRYVDIMEAEGGGVQTVSMFVHTRSADGDIDVYAEQYDDITLVVLKVK